MALLYIDPYTQVHNCAGHMSTIQYIPTTPFSPSSPACLPTSSPDSLLLHSLSEKKFKDLELHTGQIELCIGRDLGVPTCGLLCPLSWHIVSPVTLGTIAGLVSYSLTSCGSHCPWRLDLEHHLSLLPYHLASHPVLSTLYLDISLQALWSVSGKW